MSTFGKNFLAAVIAKKSTVDLLQGGALAHLFKGSEVPVFDFVMKHTKKHGVPPDISTVLMHTGEELPTSVEPPAYYRELMGKRHIDLEMKKAMLKAQDELKALTPEVALATMAGTCLGLGPGVRTARR